MNKLLRAASLCAVAALAGCTGEPASAPAQTTSKSSLGLTLRADSAGLAQTQAATGSSVKLDGRYENAVVARRNADGSLSVECHDDTQSAEAFVAGTPKAPATQELQ